MSSFIQQLKSNRRYILTAFIFLIALYVLIPQFGQFKDSWHSIRYADPWWLLAALGMSLLTYLFAALTYRLLAFARLRYLRTVVIQLTAMFVNRLLPAGIGALGANYLYLKRNKHGGPQAATVVAVNNLLGFIGHISVTLLALAIFRPRISMAGHHHFSASSVAKIAVIAVLLGIIVLISGWPKVKKALAGVGKQILSYRQRKVRLGLALISSMGLTLANVTALYCCAQALSVNITYFGVLIVFTLGVAIGTAVPTPGGLGGYEAGLVAGFVAYGTIGSHALAVALLYRLVTYWLAILIGAAALIFTNRRHYI